MKKLTLIFTLLALNSFGAEQELQKGIDLTGLTNVTGAQLNQLVDRAVPATGRGFVYISTTSPDVSSYPRFTNYLWLDQSAFPYSLKSYQTGSWVQASIGVDAIGTDNIQDAAVTGIKIANATITTTNIATNAITAERIQDGAITALKYAAGSITTDVISNNTVTTAKIVDSAITTAKIADANVTGVKIAPGSIGNIHLTNGFTIYNTNLAVNAVANTNLQTDAVQATNIVDGVVSKAKLSFSLYTNNTPAAVAIPAAGDTATIAHGLGAAPQIVRVVLRNTSTDIAWDAGDEVEIWTFTETSQQNPAFAVFVDATNVNINRTDEATVIGPDKDTGAATQIDTSKWEIKAYCVLYP